MGIALIIIIMIPSGSIKGQGGKKTGWGMEGRKYDEQRTYKLTHATSQANGNSQL